VPMTPMMCRTMSLLVTPGESGPETRTRMLRARFCRTVWVARTCSTSEVPMPKASAGGCHYATAKLLIGRTAESTMGRGVRVAADDGGTRQCEPLLGSDDLRHRSRSSSERSRHDGREQCL
jgi:hypothetical protein